VVVVAVGERRRKKEKVVTVSLKEEGVLLHLEVRTLEIHDWSQRRRNRRRHR